MQQAINVDTVTELRSVMGDDTLNEVVQVYIEMTPGQIRDLEDAIRNEDVDRVFNIAHKMKSSSNSIGALGLATCAEQIELSARGGSIDGAADRLRELETMYRDAEEYLKSEIL